jgi:hypothetical protein
MSGHPATAAMSRPGVPRCPFSAGHLAQDGEVTSTSTEGNLLTTTVTTDRLARDDAPASRTASARRVSRTWAVSGAVAGVAGIASMVTSSMVDAVYNAKIATDADKIQLALDQKHPQMIAFHVATALAAVLLVPFALGLFRRLRSALPADSLLPGVAAAGVLITSGVLILGSGLDTEFATGADATNMLGENSAMYNHWIGTIPWVWTSVGLAGVVLALTARRGGVPRWIGVVGLVLGGLALVFGISPLTYVSGMFGPLWLLVTAIGFAVGDRRHRA